MSIEAKQKLSKIRPVITQASKSVGFHQVMFLLLIYMGGKIDFLRL
jgi:hypothetical protein